MPRLIHGWSENVCTWFGRKLVAHDHKHIDQDRHVRIAHIYTNRLTCRSRNKKYDQTLQNKWEASSTKLHGPLQRHAKTSSMLKSDIQTWGWEQVGCSWPHNLIRVDTCVTCTHMCKSFDMSELKPNVQPNIRQIKVSASPWGLICALIDQTFSNLFLANKH